MIVPKDGDRSWTKPMWKYLNRFYRCHKRALSESGSFEKQLTDIFIYGTGYYTPEQQEDDTKRTMELMRGLKPTKP